jgi:hypothetical protein
MSTSQTHRKLRTADQTTYSYGYSAKIIEEFVEKYARATIFVARKLGFTPREFKHSLIVLFQFRNGKWNSVRDTLKYIDKHRLYGEIQGYEYTIFLKYLTSVRSLVEDILLERGFSAGKY